MKHFICVPASSRSCSSRASSSSLASHSLNAAGVPAVAANKLHAPSLPALPLLLTLLALGPEIAEHFTEVEWLGHASYWCGKIGRADSGIEQVTAALEQVRAAKELAVRQYAIELGKVYADSSCASSCGRSVSKGKGRARPE